MAKTLAQVAQAFFHLLTFGLLPAKLLAGLANPDGFDVLAVSKVAALRLKVVHFSACRPKDSFFCFVAGRDDLCTLSLLALAFKSSHCQNQTNHKTNNGCDDRCELQHHEIFRSEELFQALLNRHFVLVGHCYCKLFALYKLWCSNCQQLFQ